MQDGLKSNHPAHVGLWGSDLRGATLDLAVFDATDLCNARLDDVFAFNTRCLDVHIDGADFTNVTLIDDSLKNPLRSDGRHHSRQRSRHPRHAGVRLTSRPR